MNSRLIGYECDTASDGLEEQLARKSETDSFHESTQRAENQGESHFLQCVAGGGGTHSDTGRLLEQKQGVMGVDGPPGGAAGGRGAPTVTGS